MNKEQKMQELSNKIEKSRAEIDELKKELEELREKPYEISYPKHATKVYFISDFNGEIRFKRYDVLDSGDKNLYDLGLYFDTKKEAEQFLKEQTLIKKIKCWAKEQQGDWQPDWSDEKEHKYSLSCFAKEKKFYIDKWNCLTQISKIPHFKSKEIAQACIDEFGEEILEVFC